MTFLEDLARRVALAEEDRLIPSDVGIRVPCSHVMAFQRVGDDCVIFQIWD